MAIEPSTIPASAIEMPPILYGTAWKKQRTAALVETAIRAGFRGVDTACQPKHYFEPGVGLGVAACLCDPGLGLRREDLYIQTKYTPVDGQDPNNIPYDPKADLATQVEQSVAASLRNLQTPYLDCLVLHSPLHPWPNTLTVWAAMEAQVDAGHVRQLGISNCYRLDALTDLHQRARTKPVALQNRFYAVTGFDRALRAYCRAHDVKYQSFWTLTANPDLLAHPTIHALAATYHVAPAQILFRYLTQAGVVPLTGTTSVEHMREDLAIFAFELIPAECESVMLAIDAAADAA